MDNKNQMRERFDGLFNSAEKREDKVTLMAVRLTAIEYYFDTLSAAATARVKGEKGDAPDLAPMQKAVTEMNRVCASLNREPPFSGALTDRKALFDFAASLLPEGKDK